MNDAVDFQLLFNIAFALACAAGGWILNVMWNAIKDMQKSDKELVEKVAAVEVLVAGQYVTKAELNGTMERIERMFERIENKLDSKVDKK